MTISQQLPVLLQRNSILIPRLLCYLLVVLIAISSAKLVWSLFSKDYQINTATITATKTPPKLVAPKAPQPDYGSQVSRLHLMGKADVKTMMIADQNAPDTSLNLKLSGVLALGNGEGFAIIENESKKHKYYQIDDEVTSGVTLSSVHADYVLLNRSGRNEKLSLPKATPTGTMKLNSNKVNVPQSAPRINQSDLDNDIDQGSSSSLSSLKQQLTKNPSSLADHISISSANDASTGKFIGYRVNPNGNSSLFDDLGLMQDDVVVSINEIALDNPNKATQAFQKLVQASKLQMTVLREGTEITLVHNLE